MKAWAHKIINWPVLSAVFSVRTLVAGVMLIMGLGRLGIYRTTSVSLSLTMEQYGALLVALGMLNLLTLQSRLTLRGRTVAALAASLLAGMAWDIGVLSVTFLIEVWLAVFIASEVLAYK